MYFSPGVFLSYAKGDAQSNGDAASDKVYLSDAKKIIELEHKLNQALENVRQAETVRESLAEANRINETISAKLDEYQAKNAALGQWLINGCADTSMQESPLQLRSPPRLRSPQVDP